MIVISILMVVPPLDSAGKSKSEKLTLRQEWRDHPLGSIDGLSQIDHYDHSCGYFVHFDFMPLKQQLGSSKLNGQTACEFRV